MLFHFLLVKLMYSLAMERADVCMQKMMLATDASKRCMRGSKRRWRLDDSRISNSQHTYNSPRMMSHFGQGFQSCSIFEFNHRISGDG